MADEKVTLSIKQVDGSSEQSTMNISYVNPDATDKQLHSFAEETLALSYDTLVSASRVETRELLVKHDSNLRVASGLPSAEQVKTLTFSQANLATNARYLYFYYEGDGELYVKSNNAWVSVSPFQYGAPGSGGVSSVYCDLEVPGSSAAVSPQYDGTYKDSSKSVLWYPDNIGGEVVIGVRETGSYYGSEVVITITND